ncbi:MAG: hypothetical protein K9W43_09025 [Candidatus Thorarchaeota archaeon]|nr:hypothetical protein [Candidatus Thorarchaeota archaeon]
MQLIPYETLIIYSIPSILLGLGAGYVLGKQSDFSGKSRVALSIVIGFIGGLMVALFTSVLREGDPSLYLLSTLSMLGGIFFGLVVGWIPTPHRYVHHIIYEDDDDEAFDREIEAALRGSSEDEI